MNTLNQLKTRIIGFINNATTTNYALLINGAWGTGKTYFIRNSLMESLHQQTNQPPIYVSLNGVNSLEEIYQQLVSEKFLLAK